MSGRREGLSMDQLPSLLADLTLGEPRSRSKSRSKSVDRVDPLPSPTLRVYKTPRKSSSTLQFKHHTLLGQFGITGDLCYFEGAPIPPLIPQRKERFLLGTKLGLGFNSATLIQNYTEYKDLKEECFFEWLLTHGHDKERRGHFICFGGRISGTLQTPLLTRGGAWEILAAKYNDSIFLWEEHKEGDTGPDLLAFYGVAFEALMTGKDPLTLNESEKTFVVQKVSFGQHRLLLLNEIDGRDKRGEFFELKVFKNTSHDKFMKMWAQSVVPGVDRLIFGHRDDRGRLTSISSTNLDNLQWKANLSENDLDDAYDFEDRLLDWISSHFAGEENDPNKVKRFRWNGNEDHYVTCKTLGRGEYLQFFPEWFLKRRVYGSSSCHEHGSKRLKVMVLGFVVMTTIFFMILT